MARVKGAMMTRKRRNKTLKLAKFKIQAFQDGETGRHEIRQLCVYRQKAEKREFRQMWIARISAAAKMNGMNYSTLMNGLKKAGVTLNRKMLSEIAINDPAGFTAIVEKAKSAL